MNGVGIIGIDPGVMTGMAWGIFSPRLRDRTSLWKALARGRDFGDDQIDNPKGVCERTADILADWSIRGLGSDSLLIVVEDFQIRTNLAGGKAADKLAPVFIHGRIEGYLDRLDFADLMVLVDPSQSKALATDKRIKLWAESTRPPGRAGWVRGRRHSRDAWRLVAYGLEIVA